MRINSISTVAPIVASKSGAATTSSAKALSATITPTAGAPTTSSVSSTVGNSTTSTSSAAPVTSTASTPASGQTSAPPQSEVSAVSTATSILESSTYSTSVGGKSYSANISQTNGTYTLAVPNLPGASVSGSSLSEAEIALSIKINTLV